MKTLSICMIVRNEECNLGPCLHSVKDIADEFIIVDTGSTDNTVNIARSFNAKIIPINWQNDFSHARNISLDFATKDLVFWMDADDRAPARTAAQLSELKYHIKRLNTAFGFLIKNIRDGKICDEFLQPRLWPNDPNIRFERKIHEQIVFSLYNNQYNLFYMPEIFIEHLGYSNEQLTLEKNYRNKIILEDDLINYPGDPIYLSSYADILFKLQDFNKAIDTYKTVLKIKQCFEINSEIYKHAMTMIIVCYYQLNDFIKLSSWVCAAKKENIETPHILFIMAEAYYKEKKYDQAKLYYYRVLNLERFVSSTAVNYTLIKEVAKEKLNLIRKGE